MQLSTQKINLKKCSFMFKLHLFTINTSFTIDNVYYAYWINTENIMRAVKTYLGLIDLPELAKLSILL